MSFICKTMSTSNISKRFVSLLIAIASLLTTAQAAAPANPVLFVHGLNDFGSTWAAMINGLDVTIGMPTINTGARLKADIANGVGCYWQNNWSKNSNNWTPLVAGSIPSSKRFFAIDFSDNNGLDLKQQAKELKIAIDCVTQITNTSKVSLVAHSMGGLASRQYLQSTPGITNVERLITIGTPHNGVELPSQFVSRSAFCIFAGLSLKRCFHHPGTYLLTDTLNYYGELNKLNRELFSLPTNVKYHSIVGKGVGFDLNLIVHGTDEGDTVVSLFSQAWMHTNLARPPYLSSVFNTSIENKIHCHESVAHNCEPGFLPIIVDVARELGIPVDQVILSGVAVVLPSTIKLNGALYVANSTPFFGLDTLNGSAITSTSISGGIEWGTNGTFTNPPISTAISTGQHIPITADIPTQAPGTVIQYRTFTIVNGVKTVGSTQTVTIPPSTTGNLPAPTSVSPPNGASSLGERPVFTWTPVDSATSYRLMVALAEADLPTDPTIADCANCILNAIASDTTYIAPSNTFVAGKTYYWRVKARSPTQYGNVSTASRFALAAQALLPAPQLSLPLTGSSVNSSNTQLTWQAVAGATSYRVFVAQNSSVLPTDPAIADCDACIVNTTTSDLNFWLDPSLLLPGRTYYWMVKGRNAAQYGAYSEIRRFVVNQSQCSFAFAQTSLNTTAVSATYPLTLMTQPGCSAPATSNQAYCTVSPSPVTADSSGRAGLNLTIQTSGAAARACTVTVGNALLNVAQAANAPSSTWTLTLNQSAGGLATVSPNQTVFADGAQVVLTATPSSGYKFSGWQEGGSIVASPSSFPFTIHKNRSFVPVFSSTQVTVTGLVSPSVSPDQKWRLTGNAINTMVWQSSGEAINLQSGTSYRVDCADTPYYQPAVNTFSFTPGSSFTCNYSAKAQVPISPSLALRPQPRLASGMWNSLAKLDDGRAVIWGLSQFTDFPNYGAITDRSGTPVLLKPLFLPYSTDVAGVSISPGMQNGMFTLSSTGTWKRWSNPASDTIRVPTAEPALNGFVKMIGNLGLKSDNTLWFINQSGVNTRVTTLSNVVDIAGTYNSTSSPAIALRNDGAVISLADSGASTPCPLAGISSNVGSPFSNCTPPVALPGISRVISIAVASGNAYAVRDDETAWVWGLGSLTGGVPHDVNNYSPVQIPGITGAVQVVASSSYSKGVVYVRTSAGQVYAWGANDLGQLGRGTTSVSEATPQLISGLNNIVELGQTEGSSLVAMDSSGFVWTVGVAFTVGNGSTAATQSTPVKVSCPNGYVGDLNLLAFGANCVAAAVNTLTLSGTASPVLVNGQVTALPMSQSFPSNTDVIVEVVPDIGNAFRGFHGDMGDWQSRIKSIPMTRNWDISVSTGNCADYPVNSTVVVNGSDLVPLTATASGGSQTVNVYGAGGISIDNCHWGFSTTDSWIHANADGFGPSSFVVNIEPNPTTVQRIGNFKLAGAASRNIRVTQAAAAVDAAPDAFSFPSYIGAPVSTLIESSAISLSGFNASAVISIANGEYSIGCNGTFASAAGTIDNTQTLCVRQTSASAFQTSTTTTVTIGGMVGTFVVTTQADTAVPQVSLSPPSLTFANQIVGSTSASQGVTLTNAGTAVLSIASITSNNNVFGVTHNCGASVAVGANCTLSVTFSPIAAATTTSSVAINTNATGSPHSVGLSGTGIVSNLPVCTLTAAPATVRKNGPSLLTSSCANTPTSYAWTGGTCAGTTAATCAVTPAITTTYGVTATNGSGSGSASATVTVATGDITPILFLLLFD